MIRMAAVRSAPWWCCLAGAGLLAAPGLAGRADDPVSLVARYLSSQDRSARAAVARELEAGAGFDPAKVRDWLHAAWPKVGRKPRVGRGATVTLDVPVGLGHSRAVVVRAPRRYTPDRAWPLVYALHESGGQADAFVRYVEMVLGQAVEDFVVAAPNRYRQTGLDAPPPFTDDHRSILDAVKATVHVDSDRVYALGYSLGGYASWSMATTYADRFAGVVAIASTTSVPPSNDGLWRLTLPGLSHLRVLNVWGSMDALVVPGVDGRPAGTIGGLNRRFVEMTRGMDLPVVNIEVPGRTHNNVVPPRDAVLNVLATTRVAYPRSVDHRFRHVHQGSAYWIEPHTWSGERWGEEMPAVVAAEGETDAAALGRTLAERLGRVRGEVDGQTLRVERTHVGEMTVWIGDGMVDWARPVALEVDGRRVFEGAVARDLDVCLSEAARTRDFDRLRWAGIRVAADGTARPVTGATPFPPVSARQ